MMFWLSVALTTSCLIISSVGLDLPDYNQCCHYCRGDQDLWVRPEPSWPLMVGEDHVSNFDEPPAYLVEDTVESTSTLYKRDYAVRYAGAPVSISSGTTSSSVLNGQYVQLDLGFTKDVAGVSVQGGFYEEADDDLLDRMEFTITKFAVSTSVSARSFSWVKDYDGNIAVYDEGPASHEDWVLAGFDHGPISAQYVRIHPLAARDHRGQDVTDVLMRVSVVHCTTGVCFNSRSNCVVREWQGWGACTCDWAGCTETRVRVIARYQACGGTPCEGTSERRLCVPPEPLWKTIVMYAGIGVAGLILIIIIAYVIHRKIKKNQPEIIFEKDKKKKKKDKKKRKVRDDLAGENGKLEESMVDEGADEAEGDFAEKELNSKPDKKAKSEKKNDVVPPVVVTADDQPVMNAENKPVRPISKMGKSNKISSSHTDMDQLMDDIVAEPTVAAPTRQPPPADDPFGDLPPGYEDW